MPHEPIAKEPSRDIMLPQSFWDEVEFLFQTGEFFDAHEVIENVWMHLKPGTERELLWGLILYAAACHKAWRQREPEVAQRIIERAVIHLKKVPDGCHGFDMPRLIGQVEAVLDGVHMRVWLPRDGFPQIG